MPGNATYSLTGTGISITHTTEAGDLEFTLDDSFRPFDGTHNLKSADLKQHALDPGVQITGSLQHTSVGRGPRVETISVFLADAPEPADSAAEYSATGVAVFADPSPSSASPRSILPRSSPDPSPCPPRTPAASESFDQGEGAQ